MATAGEKSSPYKITQGLEVLYPGETDHVTVDIIAVPGLGSNPDTAFDSFRKTPDGKTQFNWLTDDKGLRFEFPTARVLLYKSESRWIKDAAVNQSMKNLAGNLLTSILSKREGITDRPIIFVGHSMGGLVVAKAITLASFRGEEYPNLLSCITGCLFFGTPFQGSAATGKAIMLAELLEPVNQAAVSRVLTFLVPGNEALDELRKDFARICNRLDPPIGNVCFYEERKTDYAKGFWKAAGVAKLTAEIVVTEMSATLDDADSIGFTCNHRELNRFDDSKDGRWELVRTKLKPMVVKSPQVVRSRLKAMRTSVMDDQTINRLLESLSVAKVQEKKSAVSQLSGGSSWITDNPILKQWMAIGDQSVQPNDLASSLSGLTLTSRPASYSSHNNQCVWLSGPEGRGKSKAAMSIIKSIEDLEDKNARSGNTSSIIMAYFFAAPTPDLSSAENVLKSVLWQLISKRRSLALYAKDFAHSDRGKKKGVGGASEAMFTVPAMWKVLMNMLEDPGIEAVYFVINSLHELPEDAEGTKQLFEAFDYDFLGTRDPTSPVYDAGEGRRPTRWLFTSRRRENIKTLLGQVPGVTEMDLDDPVYGTVLRQELIQHSRQRVAELARKKGYSPALRYFASSLVERKAENRIWVDVVCRQLELVPANTVEVRKTLSQAPQNLSTLLDRTWINVLDEKNEDVEWTKELLRALMIAFEDPTVEELATLAEATHYLKEEESKSKLVEAIDRCGALIKIIDYDEEELEEGEEEKEWDYDEVAECRVTFLHDSAKSRLQERAKELLGLGEEDLKMQHGAMALRSFSNVIKALTPPKEFDDSDDENEDEAPTADGKNSRGPTTNAAALEEETEEALGYCLEYWLRHAQQATSDVVDNLNLDQAFWALTSDVRDKWWNEYTEIDDDYEDLSGMTALHVAAFFGFTPLVQRLLESSESGHRRDIKTRDSWSNQPLHWAAEKGHLDVMQLLLDHGADINDGRQDFSWTPLMMAASSGELEAMAMLLARKSDPADINACASDDGTALTLAIAYGQVDAVAHLIRNNADPNITGSGLEPPLALAASTGNKTLVKMIMDARGYQNTTSPAYGSALAAAASSSDLEVLQIIFQVDRSLPSRQSALEQAAEVTSKEIVDYLLRSGPDLKCDTAFTKAAAKGADDILNMLWQYSRGAISQQSKDLSLYTATDCELNSTVKLLLAMRASPDAEGEEYGTALTAAAYDGTIDIATMLLNAGAHIRHPAGYPLQAAASQGHDDMVTLLLSRGASVNEISPKHDSGTALHAACVSGFDDTVDLLLKHRADPNLGSGTLSCPIIAATRNANSRIVEMLVNAGVNANVFGGPDNSTPLINAAMTLPVASLKTLVERGRALVNQVDKDGNSALKMSAEMDDAECVEYLLGVGADVFHREGHNGTALHAAAARGSAACCRLLLAHRASPSVLAGPHHSVIQAAASSGDMETMKLILGADPQLDVNVRGGEHGTPLHAAAMQSDTRCLKMLLDKGADANVVIGEHGTVLQTAAFTGCNKNVGILIEHGVDVNAVAGKHGTALQAAALKCATSTLQALLDAGAKLEVDDGKNTPQSRKNGKYGSALAAAAARWDVEPLEFLLEKEGWSTGTTGAYRQALETAAKYNCHVSFRLIVRSKGGKTIPKKVKSKLRHEVKKRDEEDVGDDNSDFGDDVVFNEQDPDDEDDDEEDDEEEDENEDEDEESGDKRVEESKPASPASVMQGIPGSTGQRGLGDLGRPQTSNNSGSNGYGLSSGYGPSPGYGPPPGYSSVPQAQFSPPPSSVIGPRPPGNQQQGHITGGHNQAYGQTSRAPDGKPQYRAYNNDTPPAPSAYQAYSSNGPITAIAHHPHNSNGQYEYAQNRDTVGHNNVDGANQGRSPEPQFGGYVTPEHRQGDRSIQDNTGYNQHAYAARSDETTAIINNPDATASSGYNSYQQTSRNAPSNYNNDYPQQSQLYQPSASDSGKVTSMYDAQPIGSYGHHDPTITTSSYAAPQSSYASSGYTPPSQQQQSRGFESQPQRYGGLVRKPVPTQSRAPSSSAGGYAAVAGTGAVAGGAGGYMLADAVRDEENNEEEEDEHLAHDEPVEEEQEEEDVEAVEEEEAAEDEESYDHGGYGGYSGGYDGSQYGNY